MEDGHFVYDSFLDDPTQALASVIDGHGGVEVMQAIRSNFGDEFKTHYLAKADVDIPQVFTAAFESLNEKLHEIGQNQGA
jgi:serine/threonine protein phosphatase PrpC